MKHLLKGYLHYFLMKIITWINYLVAMRFGMNPFTFATKTLALRKSPKDWNDKIQIIYRKFKEPGFKRSK